jgi:diacylglycerol kinase family enzyme
MSRASVCVIFNPTAGRQRARQRLNHLHCRLKAQAEFWPTLGACHAEELALRAAQAGFAIVAAAGGDGTVHEVVNGLLRSGRPDVCLGVLPIGSANDYAYSLGLDADWWIRGEQPIRPRSVDVGLIRAGARSRFFCNCVGLGFNGYVVIESQRIKWMQGMLLYGLAMLRSLVVHFATPVMKVQMDREPARVHPTLMLNLCIGKREGNFLIAPDAIVDDGLFDYAHAGALSRRQVLGFVPGLITGRLPTHPEVWRGRCRHARVQSQADLVAHLDGELFCVPRDHVHEVDVELLPGALRVMALDSPGGLAS